MGHRRSEGFPLKANKYQGKSKQGTKQAFFLPVQHKGVPKKKPEIFSKNKALKRMYSWVQ